MKKILIRLYEFMRKRALFLRRKLLAPSVPMNPDGKVYVNVGCGFDTSKEFINVDVLPLPHIHHMHDITDLSMFPDDSVDLMYASHVVEHLPVKKLISTLKEWRRALKPGGTLRISVPDFDNLVEFYLLTGRDVDAVRDNVLGQEPPYDNHYTLWNMSKMELVLRDAGFTNVRRWDPATAEHHDFKDRSSRVLEAGDKQLLLSLNIEADKT
jgi:predicted SAM-dependent methyltransferase